MAERVFTNQQNLIEIVYDGDHDIKDSNWVVNRLIEEVAKLKQQHQPIKLMMDLSKLGKTDRGARQNIIDVARQIKFAKVGVYGASTFNRSLARFIVFASGKASVIKIVNTRAEATNWVNS